MTTNPTTTTENQTADKLTAIRREDRAKCFRYWGHFADGTTLLLRESGNKYALAARHDRRQVTKFPHTDPRAFITFHAKKPKAGSGDVIDKVFVVVTDAIPAPAARPGAYVNRTSPEVAGVTGERMADSDLMKE